MHDGCSGSFSDGAQVLAKVQAMGFADQPMPAPLPIDCGHCGSSFIMETFAFPCPSCGMIHAVTPCHAFDPASVLVSGVVLKTD